MFDYYKYYTFGLKILSELELPDLKKGDFQKEDVSISTGINPIALDPKTSHGVLYQARKDHFLFRFENIASYYVINGNQITIDIIDHANLNDVRLFLLGPVFGALLLQRGLLPLHGSSVVKNKRSLVFCGKSGSGKSTLAALLSKKGFSLLADDVSVVIESGNYFSVLPGITHLKLWQDVAKPLYEDYLHYPKVRDSLLRYKIPVEDNLEVNENQITSIVILEKKNSPEFELEEVFGAQKFTLLKDNTYREQFIEGLETMLIHFDQLTELIQKVRVFVLRRPESSQQLHGLADFVEENLISN